MVRTLAILTDFSNYDGARLLGLACLSILKTIFAGGGGVAVFDMKVQWPIGNVLCFA